MLKPTELSWRQPATWVIAAPLICAVHCLLMPLLILALPTFAPGEEVERVILVLSALMALGSLRTSIPLHGNKLVVFPVVAGLMIWGLSESHLLPGAWHHVWTPTGSLLVAGGLFWSARLRHHACCGAAISKQGPGF